MDRELEILNVRFKDTVRKITDENSTLDPFKTKRFHQNLWKCLTSKEYLTHYKMGPVLVALDPSAIGAGNCIIEPGILGTYLENGHTKISNVFVVGYDGRIIDNPKNKLIENPADAAHVYSKSNFTVFFIYGNRIDVFYQSRLIDCIPDIQAHDDAVKIGTATLPVDKYRDLMDNHFNEKIKNKTTLKYWKNKSERKLVAAPEDVFGNDLAFYLDQYIADGRVDQECRTLWTNDRTDIRVLRYRDKKIYIFEIKWLGKSETAFYAGKNAVVRVNSGLQQLVEYLKAEKQSICGALVIYDARKENTKLKWDVKIQRKDARVVDPIRYYLISESTSKKADKIVKRAKKKSKIKSS